MITFITLLPEIRGVSGQGGGLCKNTAKADVYLSAAGDLMVPLTTVDGGSTSCVSPPDAWCGATPPPPHSLSKYVTATSRQINKHPHAHTFSLILDYFTAILVLCNANLC